MRKRWTDKERDFLKANYRKRYAEQMAKVLKRSVSSVRNQISQMGLEKPKEFWQECGRRLVKSGKANRFKRGLVPWNLGKSYNPGGRSVETRFKKGRIVPAKEFYLYPDKNGKMYKHVRVSAGKRRPLHQVNFERTSGKIPPGYILRFVDGDTMNCDPSNLTLITKEQNMRLNAPNHYPEELLEIVKPLKELKTLINGKRNTKSAGHPV